MKKINPARLYLIVGIALLCWSVGLSVDTFSSPIFRYFWWISYQSAHDAMLFALPISAVAIMLGITYWTTSEKKTKLPN
jgi:hypothetical protein